MLLAGGATINNATFTGQSLFADGSQAAPSISFTSDPDTGFFWSSSGDFRATINGVSSFAWRATNFVPAGDNSISLGLSSLRWSDLQSKQLTLGQTLSNPNIGQVTLSATGTASVQTTALTASTRIFLTHQNAAGTTGTARVTSSTAGTGFTIVSSSATDTSVIGWLLVQVS